MATSGLGWPVPVGVRWGGRLRLKTGFWVFNWPDRRDTDNRHAVNHGPSRPSAVGWPRVVRAGLHEERRGFAGPRTPPEARDGTDTVREDNGHTNSHANSRDVSPETGIEGWGVRPTPVPQQRPEEFGTPLERPVRPTGTVYGRSIGSEPVSGPPAPNGGP